MAAFALGERRVVTVERFRIAWRFILFWLLDCAHTASFWRFWYTTGLHTFGQLALGGVSLEVSIHTPVQIFQIFPDCAGYSRIEIAR